MLQKSTISQQARSDDGFSLVELLVVMMILGLLAAIAIPAFFTQRSKAADAEAKAGARAAQTAIEAYAVDRDGDYSGAGKPTLVGVEPVLSNYEFDVSGAGQGVYRITVESGTGTDFSIARVDEGTFIYECTEPDSGGCPSGGLWAGS